MIFNIDRASDGRSRTKPCDGAFLVDGFWSIDINSIDELMALIRGCGISIEWRYYENNEFEWWFSGDDGTGPRGSSIQAIAKASQDVETVLVDAILAKTQPDQTKLIGRIDRVIQLSAYFRDLESLLWSKDEQQIAAGLEWLRCHLKMPPFWIPVGAN